MTFHRLLFCQFFDGMEPQNALDIYLKNVNDWNLGILQNTAGSGEMGKSGCKSIYAHSVPFGSLAYERTSSRSNKTWMEHDRSLAAPPLGFFVEGGWSTRSFGLRGQPNLGDSSFSVCKPQEAYGACASLAAEKQWKLWYIRPKNHMLLHIV